MQTLPRRMERSVQGAARTRPTVVATMIPPKLPGPTELGPCLDQLDRHPGSVILRRD